MFFTSDTHFGDHRTINIQRRPFASVGEMDAVLEERWNARIGPDDEVWHLGDVARTAAQAAAALGRLNGRKHLIRGNNDPPALCALPLWESVADYHELEWEGRLLILCHYPFRSWNGQHRGAINLHGHSHGRLKPVARQVDVGVDVWDFGPVAAQDIVTAVGGGRRMQGRRSAVSE